MGKFARPGNRAGDAINTRAFPRAIGQENLRGIYAEFMPPYQGFMRGPRQRTYTYLRSASRGARTLSMLSVISGLVVGGAGGAALWYLKPRNGVVNPLVVKPWLDFMIPIGIVSALGFGIALIVAGLA
jgi:hypothetical protein